MTNIYKFRATNSKFCFRPVDQQTNLNETWTHVFNITPQVLEYYLLAKSDGNKYFNYKINLSDLRQAKTFGEQSIFAISDVLTQHIGQEPNNTQYTVQPGFIINTLLRTYVTKYNPITETQCPFKIIVDSDNGDFTTFSYIAIIPDPEFKNDDFSEWNTTALIQTNTGTVVEGWTDWKSVFEDIQVSTKQTTAAAGDTITVEVSCADTVSKIYLEALCGILDRTEVTLTNGVGVFNILTNTLAAGDKVAVKCGHKSFTNLVTFSQTLL